ncbi:MAG: hypothetical protein OXC48_01240 [Endozoicomonadaceae bacterium]|nr:hypothetical protein [Endozoicomonadaceae bacterium]
MCKLTYKNDIKNVYVKNYFYITIVSVLLFFSELAGLASSITLPQTLPNKQPRLLSKIKRNNRMSDQTGSNAFVRKKNKKIKLTDTQDKSSPWSNAFNFHKSWSTQVDSRTGSLSSRIRVGSMISNFDHGPNINLEINYSSSSLANTDHLGVGWSWNLTHFDLSTNQLSTSQGQAFNLQQQGNGKWLPHYHKLQDIQIDGNKDTHFTITYTNGLRETLNHEGFETKLEQQDGWSVVFSYTNTHLLSLISDNQGHRIVLNWKGGYVNITSYDNDGKSLTVHIDHSNIRLNHILLPEKNSQFLPEINLTYMKNLLTQVTYPTGLKEELRYNCTNEVREPLKRIPLCAVVLQSIDPGAGQPIMSTSYTYDKSNANEHNYLGFNAGLNPDYKSIQDILFEAPTSYTYKTTKDNKIVREVNTYDKYHLLIRTQVFSDKTGDILTEKQNFFCRTDEIDGCANTSFKDLPDTYSLPLKTVTKNWGKDDKTPSVRVTDNAYDIHGRVIRTQDAYGRTEKISYCPATGDDACPAEPAGWSLSTPVESVALYPSSQVAGSSSLSKIITDSYYQKLPNLSDHSYTLLLVRKKVHSNNEKIIITKQYYYNPKIIFNYGLVRKTVQQGTESADAGFTSITRVYHYILSADHRTKTTYNTVEINNGQFRRSPLITTSMFTSQVLKSTNASGQNVIRYHYDHWGRLTQVDSGVGTAFAVSKRYQYMISKRKLWLIITASNGLQQKIIFDNSGRQLAVFNEAISNEGKAEPGKWLPVKSKAYDAYGRIIYQDAYYIDSSGKTNKLETTFSYDDFGRVVKEKSPEKSTLIQAYDDSDRCTVSFKDDDKQNHSFITVIHKNILDEMIKKVILPADFNHGNLSIRKLCASNILSTAKISSVTYDGFGRAVRLVDPLGRTVTKIYDSLGRITETINPNGDKIHNVYNLAGQIIQKWEQPVHTNKQYLLASSQYNAAGELLWKAGEDGKKTSYTYTSDGQLATITTSAGHTISLKYNVIGLPVSEAIDDKQFSHVEYNPVTTLPVKMVGITGTTTWIYSDDKKKQQLLHTGINGYSDYHFRWQYDQNRKIISITDLTGNRITTDHDELGRIKQVNYQKSSGEKKLIMMPVYDGFSRTIAVKYGSGMQRTISYNSYGQTASVSDLLSARLLSAWRYSYDKDDNITTIIHRAGNNQQAILQYRYDMLDNLLSMNCTGSTSLPLCPRDTAFHGSGLKQAPVITSQSYTFNALNRMSQLKETLMSANEKETLSKTVNYSYNDTQIPLRLKQISTTWNNKVPVVAGFMYDVSGNMVTDSEGDHITYNAFNQITGVTTPEGKQISYLYDSSGREVKETFSEGDSRNLFYMGRILIGEKVTDAQQTTHIISNLGIAKAIDGVIHEYYEENYKGDISGILTKKTTNNIYTLHQRNIYSPYGMTWYTQNTSLPWYQRTLSGFDSEQADPVTGWQFLGAGHRTYNPEQRYFVSEDPAGDGYTFGSNNPIMKKDPTGNMSKGIKTVMQYISYAATLGLALKKKPWANILGVSLVAVISFAFMAVSLYFAPTMSPFMAFGTAISVALSVNANCVGIAYVSDPKNRTLLIACYISSAAAVGFGLLRAGTIAYSQMGALLSNSEETSTESTLAAGISGVGTAVTKSDVNASMPEVGVDALETSAGALGASADSLESSITEDKIATLDNNLTETTKAESPPETAETKNMEEEENLEPTQTQMLSKQINESLHVRDIEEYSSAEDYTEIVVYKDMNYIHNLTFSFWAGLVARQAITALLQAGAVHSVFSAHKGGKVPLRIFRYLSNYVTIFYIIFYQFASVL